MQFLAYLHRNVDIMEDVMDGRTEIPHEDCVTIKTVLSKNSDAYDVYVFGSGDCSQLGLGDEISYVGYNEY